MIKPSYVIAKRFVQKGELKMQLSDRVQKMQGSPIRKFNPIAIAAEEKGKKIYHLNIGNPDIQTPPCYLDAIKAYDADTIGYAESPGYVHLQDGIIDDFA